MKLVMTLVVRDEADIVDSQLLYHLSSGVDFVLATDHDSRDGTTEILESYEHDGHLRLFREHGEMRESEWRTRMARLASTEHAADWVINTDADEFWMPHGGSLQDLLSAVPRRYGVVWALTRHFVPRPDDGAFFAERMTARFSGLAPINDPTSPYRPHAKAAHRADPGIEVLFGSHDVRSNLLAPFRGRFPASVFHFPFRTAEQWRRKGSRRARGDKPLGQYVRASQAAEHGTSDDLYRALVVDDMTLARGLDDVSLTVDTRLRDSLHAPTPRSPSAAAHAIEDEARAVAEHAALRAANLVRTARSIDLLAERVRALERRLGTRDLRATGHADPDAGNTSGP